MTGTYGGSVPGLFTGRDLFAADYPPVRFVLPHLIPEGFTLLVGAPKAGKSWLLLDLALAAATGGTVLGERLDPRPVLVLALEDSRRRLHSRARTLGHEHGPDNWHCVLAVPDGYSAADTVAHWVETLPSVDPAPLVIVDTLGRVRGSRRPSESPYEHDYRVGAAVKSVADSVDGMALVAAHHDRKAASADFVHDASGTNGLAGSADTLLVVRRERNTPDGVLLVTGRDVDERRFAATFDAGRWSLAGDSWDAAEEQAARTAATIGKGDTARRVVDLLAERPGLTPKDVADALDITSDVARQTLSRLYADDSVDRAQGRYMLRSA